MRGTDAWPPRPADVDSDFARMYLATGMTPLGKTQMSEYGFSASAEHPRLGPVRNPWNTDHTAGASSSGSGCVRRRRRCPDRARQRRRWIDSNSRVVQRTCRAQAVPRSAAAGQRSRVRCRSASSPTGWSAARCATPRRSTPKPSGSGPPAKLRPIGHVTHAGTQAAADRRHHPLAAAGVQPRGSRADTEIRRPARRTRPSRRPPRKAASASQFRVRLRAVLGPAGDGSDSAEQAHFRRIRRDPAGQPVPGPGPACAPQSASHPACAAAAVPHPQAHGSSGPHLRRGDDADAWPTRPRRSVISTRWPTTSRSSTACKIGSRSRRCRTSRGSRPSRCRWRCRPAVCRLG